MNFCDQNYQIKLLRFYGVDPQSLESFLFQDVLPVSLHSPLERLGRKTLAPLFAALPEPLFLWVTRKLKTLLNRQSSKTERMELHPLEVFLQSHRLSQKGMWHSSPRPLILSHDVDLLSGYQKIDKISQIENKLKLHSTWHFLTQSRYPLEPELLETLVSAGHEIGLHGVWHDLYLGYRSAPYQRAFLKKGIEPLSAYHPVSFRAPALSWTPELAKNLAYSGLRVDSSLQTYNQGWKLWRPIPLEDGRLWEFPLTMQDDHLFKNMRFSNAEATSCIFQALDTCEAYAAPAVLNFHPSIIGTRLDWYEHLLQEILNTGKWEIMTVRSVLSDMDLQWQAL
ncbi:polysaccharide deacetylase family protein [Deltaproteobacteria bacterium TL4]